MATRGESTALSSELCDYLRLKFPCEDELLRQMRREAIVAGIPEIHISEEQGTFMQVFLKATGAERVLEIGTLAGYSAIVMARALPPSGRLISLELNPFHAQFARRYILRSGLADRVSVREGNALQTLNSLKGEAFDFVFLDADKENYQKYLELFLTLNLVRPGGVIAADNVFAFGRLLDESEPDSVTRTFRAFNDRVAVHPQLHACIVPVGDGLVLAYVLPE